MGRALEGMARWGWDGGGKERDQYPLHLRPPPTFQPRLCQRVKLLSLDIISAVICWVCLQTAGEAQSLADDEELDRLVSNS